MKRSIIIFAVLFGFLAHAQNKLDFNARLKLDETRRNIALRSANVAVEPVLTVIATFSKDSSTVLDGIGMTPISAAGNVAVLCLTPEQLEQLSMLSEVVSISLDRELEPLMKSARESMRVDAVHAGIPELEGLSFKGRGVVTGLYDTGLDVNHVNFLNADGSHRVKVLCNYTSSGEEELYFMPEDISKFTTDDRENYHGTHVLGIMAGSYNGPARYAVSGTEGVIQQSDPASAIPFYGVATESDIAVACGPLYTSMILKGMQRIIDYAKGRGKPCVINLSLGSNVGPHDGTDSFSRYLAELGKDAIICMAAGNEGNYPISFKTTDEPVKTFIASNMSGSSATGTLELWASDDRPFKVHFIGYDKQMGEVFRYSVEENMKGSTFDVSTLNGYQFVFDGSAFISSNINTTNNRYNVGIALNLKGAESTMFPAIIVEPAEGQTVWGYSASTMKFTSRNVDGFIDGSSDGSINDSACGENVLVVGAYCSADGFNTLYGSRFTYTDADQPGEISYFSSYGESFDGRQLPDVCAPGEIVVSSFNQYYINNFEIPENNLCAVFTPQSGRLSSWSHTQGTSMSSPAAAGVIALWLEADPTLTIDDVKQVIRASSVKDSFTARNPERWGAGKIDALGGVRYILTGDAAVNKIESERLLNVRINDADGITITSLLEEEITANLFDLTGKCIASAAGRGHVEFRSLVATGLYILKIDSPSAHTVRKISL